MGTPPPEDYTPRYVGDTSTPLLHSFVEHSGAPIPLLDVSAAAMTFRLHNLTTGLARAGRGTWTITDAPGGQAAYAWHADDVAEAGPHEIQTMVPMPEGPRHFAIRVIDFLIPL